MSSAAPIKVMIVDDSAIVRQVVREILQREPDITVIGAAFDPLFAYDKMQKQWPDVLLLDIAMPRMDGITFLRRIMSEQPTPVVVMSALTERNVELSMLALASGALCVINKPAIGFRDFMHASSSELVHAIRAAAQAKVQKLNLPPIPEHDSAALRRPASMPPQINPVLPSKPIPATPMPAFDDPLARGAQERRVAPKLTADAVLPAPASKAQVPATPKIVVIGTSTGGTQALEQILPQLRPDCPPLAIVQHMPEKFTASFADRLDMLSQIEVREAQHNDRMRRGLALLAPGGKHLLLRRNGNEYYVEVIDGPLVTRHRPSVDVLFRSAAVAAGQNTVAFLLTGMGDDGARGLLELRQAGAQTYAQDEESCVVFGMPKEGIALGAAQQVVALGQVVPLIQAVH
ncbi:chemotaxis response regulator protein-glutamate methylesterase [Chitinibacter tainanensis]|uniref:protein-glutamate methylesterase/protein-glutamine glutaminase n=1 Tax=Chitinibacter tainanensis TaxID=230667 RepID=UPI002353C703|nr:chemotaxis response regulator protein-glutamate methylesterase [Chitinibacter tainanensis]